MNPHVESRLQDAQRSLRRLADTCERNGFLMLEVAARSSLSELQDAADAEHAFREARGLR